MKVYKKLFSFVPNEKKYGLAAIALSIVSVLLTVAGYYYIFQFLEQLIIEEKATMAQSYAVKTVVLLTLGAIIYMVSVLLTHMLGFRLETNLRKKGIEGLTEASFRFFDLNSSGTIRKVIDDNAAKTHTAVAHLIPDNAQAFLTPLLVVGLGFYVSLRVGLILVALILIGVYLFKKMTGDNQFIQLYQDSLNTLSAETVEYVRGIQVIKIFGAKVESFKALHNSIKNYSKYAYDYSLSGKKPYVAFQWLFFGLLALLILPLSFTIHYVSDLQYLVVELTMLLFLSGVIFISFMRVMYVSMYLFEASYSVETLEKIYDDMRKDKLTYGTKISVPSYDLALTDVSFSYGETPVLENFNLTFQEGKSYALVGSSGSGKSTIAKLISGFYGVDKGVISLGGIPLSDYTQETIIESISFVFQDAKLFNQTIYDNVAIGNPNAKPEEVLQALNLAGCDSILAKFTEGEQTLIGAKGVYLSGGEKQRIAIARAILKDSPIIIMDEASASIDSDNEYELQKAFQSLMKDRTVIMIAHRLSSIRTVDEIIVMDDGKVVERGTHHDLLQQSGYYESLIQNYEGANEWRVVK